MVDVVETKFLELAMSLLDFSPRIPLGTFSILLGTEEMVHIRQDYCRIHDCIRSTGYNTNSYFTGSKAEGLDLPGSDIDFMGDINTIHDLQVTEKEQDTPNIFVMSTENVRPCYAMLRSVGQMSDMQLPNACQEIDSSLYLSSYLFVLKAEENINESDPDMVTTRQGPSVEAWNPYSDRSKSGQDNVYSIHCSFWPDAAREWPTRRRKFGWPS